MEKEAIRKFVNPTKRKIIVFILLNLLIFFIYSITTSDFIVMSAPKYDQIIPIPLPIINYTSSCGTRFSLGFESNDTGCLVSSFEINYHSIALNFLVWFLSYISACGIVYTYGNFKR